jgi:hypothetical protein
MQLVQKKYNHQYFLLPLLPSSSPSPLHPPLSSPSSFLHSPLLPFLPLSFWGGDEGKGMKGRGWREGEGVMKGRGVLSERIGLILLWVMLKHNPALMINVSEE